MDNFVTVFSGRQEILKLDTDWDTLFVKDARNVIVATMDWGLHYDEQISLMIPHAGPERGCRIEMSILGGMIIGENGAIKTCYDGFATISESGELLTTTTFGGAADKVIVTYKPNAPLTEILTALAAWLAEHREIEEPH